MIRRMLCCLVVLLPTLLEAQDAPPPGFDAYVAGVMADFGVPGLTIAIVKDDHVVLAKGYGVRELGKPDRVDAHTTFGIASNTKLFTSTALGLLVEEGKIKWDEPVITYLPWFRLSDPWVTTQLTVRDLLVHRSGLGLGAGDLLWWPGSDFNRRQIAERLRHIPLATSFRSAYAYDNVLYLVAGEVIEAVTGMSWEDFVATRILAKVGMNDSRVRHSDATAGGNVSGTHGRVDGTVRAIAPFDKDNVDPAGGINASATDMAKWLMVQLDSGRVAGGERLFQPSTTTQLWNIVTPRTPYRLSGARAPLSTNFIGYALGLNVQDYRGQKLLTHTGGLPGYISRVAMLPGQKLGVAVLTNMESSAMEPIVWHVLDYYLGVHDTDWRTAFRELAARNDSMIAATDARAAASRDSTMGPSLPLARYAGHYEDAWYGGVDLAVEDGHLVVRFGHTRLLVGDLSHWQYETFLVRWRDRELRADAFITFTLDAQGRVSEARMAPASPSVDFSFDFQDLKLVPARR